MSSNEKQIQNVPTDKDNIVAIVISLRNPICYKNKCQIENNILYKCIYCKKYLSATQWSPLLEDYIKTKFSLKKPVNNTSGDGCSKNNKNIEIKVSLGDTKGNFNFVQIRPDHDVNFYILMCFNVYEDELGKIYWFLCPADKLYNLLPKYGRYAHGTTEKFGKITLDNLFGHNYEYALRPQPAKNIGLWKILTEQFSCDEKHITTQLS